MIDPRYRKGTVEQQFVLVLKARLQRVHRFDMRILIAHFRKFCRPARSAFDDRSIDPLDRPAFIYGLYGKHCLCIVYIKYFRAPSVAHVQRIVLYRKRKRVYAVDRIPRQPEFYFIRLDVIGKFGNFYVVRFPLVEITRITVFEKDSRLPCV